MTKREQVLFLWSLIGRLRAVKVGVGRYPGGLSGKEKVRVNPSFGRKGMQAEGLARSGPEGGRGYPM